MLQTIISRLGWFVFLFLLQVLVFNHVHIFGYATPMPYIFPPHTPQRYPPLALRVVRFCAWFAHRPFYQHPRHGSGQYDAVGLARTLVFAYVHPH